MKIPFNPPLITNEAIILGILVLILAFVFTTSSSKNPKWKTFYKYVPSLLLCYFLPSIFSSLGIIPSEGTNVQFAAKNILLPASLVLFTLSIDFKAILNLGPKAIIMFLTGTIGIIIGGPLALMLVAAISPEAIIKANPMDVWEGLATIAGSWIGGGANQLAMKEIFKTKDEIYEAMLIVDIFVANLWMAFLLYGAGISKKVDKFFKADSSAITKLKEKIANYQESIKKIPTTTDLIIIIAIAFSITALGHLIGDTVGPWVASNAPSLKKFNFDSNFFWVVIIATTFGLILSFTKVRKLESAGASKIGTVFLYILVASIGMKMNFADLIANWGIYKYFILIGLFWMSIHIIILLTVAKIIKAPFFFTAVGSQANIGGAASAPIVASAFHPSLASVGVLLAVLGYAVGTYGAWLCGKIMEYLTIKDMLGLDL